MNMDDFNVDKVKRVGIDKLKLSALIVLRMDIKKIACTGRAEIVQSADLMKPCIWHMPDSGAGISKIVIKDNRFFSDLLIGCGHDSNNRAIEYVYLTLCVSHAKGCNLENMTYCEYGSYISEAIRYIDSEYGIELYAGYMKVDYMEINANILLGQGFPQYSRALRLLMSLFHNHLGKLSAYESMRGEKAQGESFRRGNNSTEVIFYDKAKQLEDSGVPIDGGLSILRIELKLKNRKTAHGRVSVCNVTVKRVINNFVINNPLSALTGFRGCQGEGIFHWAA